MSGSPGVRQGQERLMQAIAGVLTEAARRTGHDSTERPGAFWEAGTTTDAGSFRLVRQADRTLPDGRTVPGPWLAYPAQRQEYRAPPMSARLAAMLRSEWEPGALVSITCDGSGEIVAQQVAERMRQWQGHGPVQVISALTAPTDWGDPWHVPTTGTVVVHSLWMSLAAPQVGAIADAVLGRRRTGMVLVMAPNVGQARGAAAEHWSRIADVVSRVGRTGAA